MHILLKILFSSLIISFFVLGEMVMAEPSRAQVFLSLIPLGSTVLLATVVFMLLAQPKSIRGWLDLSMELPGDQLSSLGTKIGVAGLLFLGVWTFLVGAGLATLRM